MQIKILRLTSLTIICFLLMSSSIGQSNDSVIISQTDSLMTLPKNLQNYNFSQELLKKIDKTPNNDLKVKILEWVGNYYRLNKQLEKALEIFYQLNEMGQELNDSNLLCHSFMKLGSTYSVLDNKNKALIYLDKAMNVSIEALPASSGEKLSYEGSKTISVNLKFKAISQVVNFKRAEIFRDLNTLLLFPSLSTEFLNQLKNFYEKNLNGDNRLADIRFEDIQHEIVLELINIYLEDCLSKDFLLDLPTYHKIKVKMKSSPEPLKELFTFINDVISTQRFHHPMISFAPKASRVKFLLSRSHELREYLRRKIKQILFQISPSIPQFYPLLFEELRNILSSYFNIDIMSENLRKEFIDALMLSLFGSNELDIQILEYYFNVKEITPQINVSNPRNNEINFEKSEEEYSTTGSLNDNIHTHFDKVNQDSQTLNKGIEVNLENVMSKINSNIKLMTILMGINGLALILIIIAFLLK